MFKKVLIANRGEIAVRIARTLREMRIPSVAVYSDVDRASLHVRMADEAHPIGPAPATESYLRVERIIDVAKRAGAEAIHPGYGFLSENPALPEACEAAKIVFIGPPASAMRKMGNKPAARAHMAKAGVPIVPGGPAASLDEAVRTAKKLGYPVMLKAAAGGGGKGMRLVERESDLKSAYESAKSISRQAFGDDTVYLEKAIVRPRHVEIQVLADKHGNVVHFFERDCSIQRRHQKVVEETPCPVATPALVAKMGEVAVRGAQAVDYNSAGTFEFLLDAEGSFYFLEMNTRLQVEHPVTEWITGVDLVREMVRVAAGERLGFTQPDHRAARCLHRMPHLRRRPGSGFLPSPGTITAVTSPSGPGVRDDSSAYPGAVVSSFYDPLISKLSVWGADRAIALARMRRALDEYRIAGVRTNLAFHQRLLENAEFAAGRYDTGFLGEHEKELVSRPTKSITRTSSQPRSPWRPRCAKPHLVNAQQSDASGTATLEPMGRVAPRSAARTAVSPRALGRALSPPRRKKLDELGTDATLSPRVARYRAHQRRNRRAAGSVCDQPAASSAASPCSRCHPRYRAWCPAQYRALYPASASHRGGVVSGVTSRRRRIRRRVLRRRHIRRRVRRRRRRIRRHVCGGVVSGVTSGGGVRRRSRTSGGGVSVRPRVARPRVSARAEHVIRQAWNAMLVSNAKVVELAMPISVAQTVGQSSRPRAAGATNARHRRPRNPASRKHVTNLSRACAAEAHVRAARARVDGRAALSRDTSCSAAASHLPHRPCRLPPYRQNRLCPLRRLFLRCRRCRPSRASCPSSSPHPEATIPLIPKLAMMTAQADHHLVWPCLISTLLLLRHTPSEGANITLPFGHVVHIVWPLQQTRASGRNPRLGPHRHTLGDPSGKREKRPSGAGSMKSVRPRDGLDVVPIANSVAAPRRHLGNARETAGEKQSEERSASGASRVRTLPRLPTKRVSDARAACAIAIAKKEAALAPRDRVPQHPERPRPKDYLRSRWTCPGRHQGRRRRTPRSAEAKARNKAVRDRT